MNNFDFETLRGRKNDFYTEIVLGTCSETSNYPWDTISWPQNKYSDVHSRKRKNFCEKRPKPPIFGPFWGVVGIPLKWLQTVLKTRGSNSWKSSDCAVKILYKVSKTCVILSESSARIFAALLYCSWRLQRKFILEVCNEKIREWIRNWRRLLIYHHRKKILGKFSTRILHLVRFVLIIFSSEWKYFSWKVSES